MINIEALSFRYDNKEIFHNLNLQILDHEVLSLLAPSGYGKTTLARILAGLETNYQGSITGNGTVSYLFQEDRLLPWLSVKDNINLPLKKEKEFQNALHYLKLLGLTNEIHSFPTELSGGMARRVALIRAFSYDSDLLILDEPLKGLNPELRDIVIKMIVEEKCRRSVLVLMHSREEVLPFSDRIIDLSQINQIS